MNYIKLYEDFTSLPEVEDILLQFIDDGKCVVTGNNNIKQFEFNLLLPFEM